MTMCSFVQNYSEDMVKKRTRITAGRIIIVIQRDESGLGQMAALGVVEWTEFADDQMCSVRKREVPSMMLGFSH